MTEQVEALLHSEASLVVVEAAAGCGKTWTAVKFASEMSDRLPLQRVLLLSHTHAACGEFDRRCEGTGLRVDVETCDSFALKVVAPYAAALGLPVPLQPMIGRTGGVSFGTLSVKAVELLQRAPTVARLIAARYPIIILDEHQDASLAQHELVMLLMRVGGARLRIFGDPMQALHRGDAEQYVDWHALWRACEVRAELTEPKRWAETPALGQWVTAARAALRSGASLPMRDAPPAVEVVMANQLAGRQRFKDPQRAAKLLHAFLDGGAGRSVILAHLGDMVRMLAQGTRWRAGINEGAVLEHLDALLIEAERDDIAASGLASAFIAFVDEIGTGFAKQLRQGIAERIGPTLRVQGAGIKQQSWLDVVALIYANPSHRGLSNAMGVLQRASPAGYKVRLKDHASTLCALGNSEDPRGHLQALSRLRRRRSLPQQSASTVHKAKGLEFRRVLICPADHHQYPPNDYGARLLYVAMSRATHELTIVADPSSPVSHLDFTRKAV